MWKIFNAKCENWRYMWKNYAKCEKMRLSKCVKYFDSKCVKIDAICANFILTLFVKIKCQCLPNLWTVNISTLFIFIYDNSPHNAFVCELGYMRIMTRYDYFYDRHIILNNAYIDWNWSKFTFGQLVMRIGATK